MLLLCQIAELSCLLNLLTMLIIPPFFPLSHLHTTRTRTSVHSPRSHSFPSRWAQVSTTRARGMHSTFKQDRPHSPFNLFQYIQAPSQFPPIDNFIPLSSPHRRGPRVTCWISLPRFPSTIISLPRMIPISPLIPWFLFSFFPWSCV